MATPTETIDSPSDLVSNTGPPQRVLQRLLEEIRSSESETAPDTSYTTSAPSSRRSCVWLPTSTIAQDASERLRAVELGRRMTSSIHNTSDSSASAKDDSFALPVRRSTMPIRWNSVTSDNNVDSPPENAVKDTSVAPNDPGAGIPRLSTTGPESPQMSASVRSSLDTTRRHSADSANVNENKSGNGNASLRPYPAFDSGYAMGLQARPSGARPQSNTSAMSALPSSLRRGSSIDPVSDATISRLTGAPVTHARNSVVNLLPTFNTIDSDRGSRFMSRYGEDYRSHRLCLDCFQQHGNFCRMLSDSCEVCDGIEPLESHYWERGSSK